MTDEINIFKLELDVAVDVGMHALLNGSSTLIRFTRERRADRYAANLEHCVDEMVSVLQTETSQYAVIVHGTSCNVSLDNSPTWVIGACDTNRRVAYDCGLPEYCISLALLVNKKPVFGVVSAPLLQQIYCAIKGRGAYCNGERIHVSPGSSLDKSIVFFNPDINQYFAHKDGGDCTVKESLWKSLFAFQKELILLPVHSLRAIGMPDLEMCLIAAGKVEISIFATEDLWMHSAGMIILQEAGGVVFSSNGLSPSSNQPVVFATCCDALAQSTAAMALKHSFVHSKIEKVITP